MKKYIFLLLIISVLSSCKPAINLEKLYGKWKYVKVENPNAHPPDSVRKADLEEQSPYIVFNKDQTVQMVWGGKQLSHGRFRINGSSIMYQEDIGGSKTREFPFFVSALDGRHIVFETLGEEGSRVTAVKY